MFYINDEGLVCLEEWRDVPNYEGHYQVSDLGRLKGLDRILKFDSFRYKKWKGKILKGNICKKKGYIKCCFLKNGNKFYSSVHIIVAKAFILNPLNLPEVNHIGKYPDGREGNKLDNRAISLEWCTRKQNMIHAKENGLLNEVKKGEESNFSKLTEKEVLEIREEKTLNGKQLSTKYNVTPGLISMILNNKIWNHI